MDVVASYITISGTDLGKLWKLASLDLSNRLCISCICRSHQYHPSIQEVELPFIILFGMNTTKAETTLIIEKLKLQRWQKQMHQRKTQTINEKKQKTCTIFSDANFFKQMQCKSLMN